MPARTPALQRDGAAVLCATTTARGRKHLWQAQGSAAAVATNQDQAGATKAHASSVAGISWMGLARRGVDINPYSHLLVFEFITGSRQKRCFQAS